MRSVLDLLAAHIAQEAAKHRGDANTSPVRRKTGSSSLQGACGQSVQLLVRRTVGNTPILSFGQADDATRTADAQAFTYQRWPCGFGHKSDEQATIHQVKGSAGE